MRGPERSPWVGEQPVGSGNLPGAGPGMPIASCAAPEQDVTRPLREPCKRGRERGARSWGHLLPTEMDAETRRLSSTEPLP